MNRVGTWYSGGLIKCSVHIKKKFGNGAKSGRMNETMCVMALSKLKRVCQHFLKQSCTKYQPITTCWLHLHAMRYQKRKAHTWLLEYSGNLSRAQGITLWWSFGSPRHIQFSLIVSFRFGKCRRRQSSYFDAVLTYTLSSPLNTTLAGTAKFYDTSHAEITGHRFHCDW